MSVAERYLGKGEKLIMFKLGIIEESVSDRSVLENIPLHI